MFLLSLRVITGRGGIIIPPPDSPTFGQAWIPRPRFRISSGDLPKDAVNSWTAWTAKNFDYRGVGTQSHANRHYSYNSLSGTTNLAITIVACGPNLTICTLQNHIVTYTHTDQDSSGQPWYIGTGTVPSDKFDFWETVTHELGHWITLGDLVSPNPNCPSTIARSSMCHAQKGSRLRRQPDVAEDINSAADAVNSP